jgi:Ca-activated chloride channel family protein
MTFRWQYALWLLVLLPALACAYVRSVRRSREALRGAGVKLESEARTRRDRILSHMPACLFLTGIAALLLSVARPVLVMTAPSDEGTVILLMDVSLSMAASDVPPTRLQAARAAAVEFVKQQPSGVRIGVVAFGGHADLVQQPTTDRDAVLSALDHLELQRFTAIGNGLMGALLTLVPTIDIGEFDIFGAGHTPFPEQRVPLKPVRASTRAGTKAVAPGSRLSTAIILISDGRGTMGVPPDYAAKLAAELGIRVYTIGVGTLYGGVANIDGWPPIHADFDEDLLKEIASVTHGDYFLARTADKVSRIYQKLGRRVVLKKAEYEITAVLTMIGVLLMLGAAALSLFASTSRGVRGA